MFWFSQRKENLENYCYNGTKNRKKEFLFHCYLYFPFLLFFIFLHLYLSVCHLSVMRPIVLTIVSAFCIPEAPALVASLTGEPAPPRAGSFLKTAKGPSLHMPFIYQLTHLDPILQPSPFKHTQNRYSPHLKSTQGPVPNN